MNKQLEHLQRNLKKLLLKKPMPTFEKPMLATLTNDYFSSADWIYERKLDGERCLVFKNKNRVHLKSRNDKNLDASYPEIIEATENLDVNQIILDGEIVAFEGNVTSFSKLQPRLGIIDSQKAKATGIKVYIYIFDILYLDGYDLTLLPLEKRKSILKRTISFDDPLRYTIHKNETGEQYYTQACHKGWEGIIAKKRTSPYIHSRSRYWLKFKCVKDQELVIAGFTEPEGGRIGFGALLLGYYENGKLKYAGKVGTGFSDDFLKHFGEQLKQIETKKNYFSSSLMKDKNVHFVKPKFVAQIGFENWTKDNKLRHPRFQGLRDDKNPKAVAKETPKK